MGLTDKRREGVQKKFGPGVESIWDKLAGVVDAAWDILKAPGEALAPLVSGVIDAIMGEDETVPEAERKSLASEATETILGVRNPDEQSQGVPLMEEINANIKGAGEGAMDDGGVERSPDDTSGDLSARESIMHTVAQGGASGDDKRADGGTFMDGAVEAEARMEPIRYDKDEPNVGGDGTYGDDALGKIVKSVQGKLMENGFELPAYRDDGWYGEETHFAVTEYQKAKGLEVTGEIDATLMRSLGL